MSSSTSISDMNDLSCEFIAKRSASAIDVQNLRDNNPGADLIVAVRCSPEVNKEVFRTAINCQRVVLQ